MGLAEYSVPKMNALNGWENGREGGPSYCSVEEGAVAFAARHPAGKTLFLSDGSSYKAFAGIEKSPRAVSLVLDTDDCLPVFSMPDGVSCILAAGEKRTLWAARYFAAVRKAPCALFPLNATADGAYETRGTVLLNGERTETALPDGEVYCDLSAMGNTFANAYARLLLSRLALIEIRALRAFRLAEGAPEAEERAFSLLMPLNREISARETLELNAALRLLERDGLPAGEGLTLSRTLSAGAGSCEWRAYLQLSALYAAFFLRGKPRRYLVPDYAARAAEAGEAYRSQNIPTEEQFAFRAVTLEKIRAGFAAELKLLLRSRNTHARTVRALGGMGEDAGSLEAIRLLPERARGLSCVIRDFGLMERLGV